MEAILFDFLIARGMSSSYKEIKRGERRSDARYILKITKTISFEQLISKSGLKVVAYYRKMDEGKTEDLHR